MTLKPPHADKLSSGLCGLKRILLCGLLAAAVTHADARPPEIPSAYQQVASNYQIPADILYGIALNESGLLLKSGRQKKIRPWPWTLNVAGMPRRYPTRKAAYQAIQFYLRHGITLIDIGLMQVNWHHHKKKLIDPWTALDPLFNLRVGATILKHEYTQVKNWPQAIGRYHSPGKKPQQKKRARRYASRVMKHVRKLRHKT